MCVYEDTMCDWVDATCAWIRNVCTRQHLGHTQCVSGHHVGLETACVIGDTIWTQCVSGGTMCVWWNNVSPEIVRHNVYLKRQCVSGGHNVLSTMSMPQSCRVPGKSYKSRGFNTKNTIPQGFNTKCTNIKHQMHVIKTLSFDIPLETQCVSGGTISVWRLNVCLETQCVTGETMCVWRHTVCQHLNTQCASGATL